MTTKQVLEYIESRNSRNGCSFEDREFRMVALDGTISDIFLGSELKSKLDALKTLKGSAVFEYKCPHVETAGACSTIWHPYSATINGNEYIDHYFASKMASVGSVWIDLNDFSGTADQGSGNDSAPSGGSSEGGH